MLADKNDMVLFSFDQVQANTLADGSLSIKIHTPELTATKIAQIMEMRKKVGFAAFRTLEFTPDEIKNMAESDVDFETQKGKSQSERLRNVLFALWKHEDPIGTDWNEYYRTRMETVISHFKSKLPERD